MELESPCTSNSSSSTSIATTAINKNNLGITCRRCLHHRRHHHRTRSLAPFDNDNTGDGATTTFKQRENQQLEEISTLMIRTVNDIEMEHGITQEHQLQDNRSNKHDYSDHINPSRLTKSSSSGATKAKTMKVQLDERICQLNCAGFSSRAPEISNKLVRDHHHPKSNSRCNSHKHNLYPVDNNTESGKSTAGCKSVLTKRSHHVIFSLKNVKMIAVLVQIALLTFSLLPTCQASEFMQHSSETDRLFNVTRHHFHSGSGTTPRINISRQSNHRLVSHPVSAPPTQRYTQADWNSYTSHLSSVMNDDINTGNHNQDAGNNVKRVGGNLSPDEERGKKVVTRKTTMGKGSTNDGLDVPFVRAHPPGSISHMNGDRSTKGSSTSSSPSSSVLGSVLGGKLMMLTPQLGGMIGAGDNPSTRLLEVGPCLCWNTTDDGHKREVECKCTGQEMTNVTSLLPPDIHRLTVEQAANFTTLGNDDLKAYGESLSELVLSELPAFQVIKNNTFRGMKRLNTVYIHGAPALTQIADDVFNVYLPELKIIRITHSGLEVVPNLSQLHIRGPALHMVEIENSKISRLIPGSFNGLTAEHLALSYNSLEEILPSAFAGATIARLTLKGNPLKVLHSDSFVGIDSLRVLDLSETKITYLPTQGLNGLESLRLEKVWTLSVIPSIYHFQELEEAWLTWPYHCCAFEYPETHDPASYQKYQDYVRTVLNEMCANASANGSSSTTEHPLKNNDGIGQRMDGSTSGSGTGGFHTHSDSNASASSQRHKRHLRLLKQANALKRNVRSTGGYQHGSRRMSSTLSSENNLNGHTEQEVVWANKNTHTNSIYKNIMELDKNLDGDRDAFLKKVLSDGFPADGYVLKSNGGFGIRSFNPSVSPRHAVRLVKRSPNGNNHPRLAQRRNVGSGFSFAKNEDEKETNGPVVTNDGFHHPHVHHGSGIGSTSSGDTNPLPHPFDTDDGSALHYGKIEPEDTFDPFVFDPDQSFAPIVPNDLEHESQILGKDTWGTFGHASEAEFDEDIGVFHPSVTPSPTVITLCGNVVVKKPPKITCHPLPDAFNPCEDIMGSIWLRGAVWVVVALSLVGNSAVLIVLLLAPGRISVQRFLMANLSWADLCMGIYLLMVATQDLVSLGSYFNYAIDWQLGWGCQIAGFLTVFASELSVFTLAVITGERWYALTRAIHLTKRLTLLGAGQLMAFGWFMAILLAALPLMGVSSFSKTSICLPMEASSGGAVVYLIFLLLFNGVAFLLVACAYWQMYRAVAGHGRQGNGASPAASSADTAIAKKMALLVFTDFACWAPVAFFGLTAVGGMPLIGVTDAKILLVFFYPLNACCNPYLYAILTKQYRRDLLLLLSRHGLCTKRAARYKTGAASTNNTVQTMQTVLRMGSMTETKVAGGGGGGRGSVLVNGGRPSVSVAAANNILEDDGLLVLSAPRVGTTAASATSASASSSQNKLKKEQAKNELQPQTNILDHPLQPNKHSQQSSRSSCEDFRKALNLHPPPIDDDDDDDVFDINGLNGRHIAETTFISVPLSGGNGGTGKNKKFGEIGGNGSTLEKVGNGDPAKEKLIQHVVEQHHQQQHDKKTCNANSPSNPKDKLANNGNSALLSPSKEEHDLEHEITETTPFCK